jgi:hypothetical protein
MPDGGSLMHRLRLLLSSLLVPLGTGIVASAAGAQMSPVIDLEVTVLDARTDEPVVGATVIFRTLWGDDLGRRQSDALGKVTFQVRRHLGGIRIRAGRQGYRMLDTPRLDLSGHDYFGLVVRMDVEAIPLAPLEVVARGRRYFVDRSHILEGFDHRVRLGFGTYFTRDQIEEIGPLRVSDLLRRVPGVTIVPGGTRTEPVLSMNRAQFGSGGGSCPVQIFMDGMLVTRAGVGPISVDELATPQALEGVEIYRGLSTVPADFLNENAHCGVVALWTRRGGVPPPPPPPPANPPADPGVPR